MKNFLRYYNVLRLTVPTQKQFWFMMIFAGLNFFAYDFLYSVGTSFTIGYEMVFIVSLFTAVIYNNTIRTTPTNPMYSFPFTSRQRTSYGYLSGLMYFVSFVVFWILLVYIIAAIVYLFGNVSFWTDMASESLAGSNSVVFVTGYLLVVYALFMPLSFVTSTLLRYVIGFVELIFLSIVNVNLYTGMNNMETSYENIKLVIDNSPNGASTAYIVLGLGLLLNVGSYILSLRMNRLK